MPTKKKLAGNKRQQYIGLKMETATPISFIRLPMVGRQGISPSLIIGGSLVEDKQQIEEELLSYFKTLL